MIQITKTTKINIIPFGIIICLAAFCMGQIQSQAKDHFVKYKIVDTGQEKFYNNRTEISKPSKEEPFYGQDAQYKGNQPSYMENGDGTVTDLVTGLMWSKAVDSDKVTLDEAKAEA